MQRLTRVDVQSDSGDGVVRGQGKTLGEPPGLEAELFRGSGGVLGAAERCARGGAEQGCGGASWVRQLGISGEVAGERWAAGWFKEGAVISAWSSGIRIPATSPVISGGCCAEPDRKGRGRC